MPRMRHGRPKYPSAIPLTHLQSHLSIYNPTYPSTIPLIILQSHLPIYNPTYHSTIPLTHLQSHLSFYNPTYPTTIALAAGAAALDLVLLCAGPCIEGTRCRRAPRGGSSGAPPGSHLARCAVGRAASASRRAFIPRGPPPLRPAVAAGPVFGLLQMPLFLLPLGLVPVPVPVSASGTARPRSLARPIDRLYRRSTRRRCACSRA
jgi:hypothetical protein